MWYPDYRRLSPLASQANVIHFHTSAHWGPVTKITIPGRRWFILSLSTVFLLTEAVWVRVGFGFRLNTWFNVGPLNPFEAITGIKDYTNNRDFVLWTWEDK